MTTVRGVALLLRDKKRTPRSQYIKSAAVLIVKPESVCDSTSDDARFSVI
jgi:hypothetical protein